MSNKTNMNGIYDIATAFITDRNTQVNADCSKYGTRYTFTKRGLADYPYCMIIYIPCGAPEQIKLKGSYTFYKSKIGKELCMKWHQPYITDKKQGEIYLHRGSTITGIHHERTLLSATTKHNVGRAIDKTQRDITRFITRMLSPHFFKLAIMAENRITGKIQTTDNTAQLFNMIYRIKQK